MHSTESIRSISVINIIKWESDIRRVAVGAKCTSLVEHCTPLPENSLDLHDLEKWPLSRLKIQNLVVEL